MDENTRRRLGAAKKKLRRLERSPYKNKQKENLRARIIGFESLLYSQPILSFRKKAPTFNNLEAKHLGKVKALSLKTPTSLRDYKTYKTRWH